MQEHTILSIRPLSGDDWLTLDDVKPVDDPVNSPTDEVQSRRTTMITTNHLMSDGYAKDVTTIGTKQMSQSPCGREVTKEAQPLTLSTAASRERARTSVAQDLAQAWVESEVNFIGNCIGLSKRYVPNGFSSKTSRRSALGDFSLLCDHLPHSGMTVAGRLYRPQNLVPRTCASDGSYLPTLAASEPGSNQGGAKGRTGKVRPSLSTMARKNLWPTLCARDWKQEGQSGQNRNTPSLPTRVGGQLNPTWTEWFMGYQCGWTELNAWAIAWFRSKRGKRS